MAKPEIDALRNPRCGAALGKDHVSGASCDFPTGHSCAHGVNSRKDEPQRRVVAECWTCGILLSKGEESRLRYLYGTARGAKTIAKQLTSKIQLKGCRAADHDVREENIMAKQETRVCSTVTTGTLEPHPFGAQCVESQPRIVTECSTRGSDERRVSVTRQEAGVMTERKDAQAEERWCLTHDRPATHWCLLHHDVSREPRIVAECWTCRRKSLTDGEDYGAIGWHTFRNHDVRDISGLAGEDHG